MRKSICLHSIFGVFLIVVSSDAAPEPVKEVLPIIGTGGHGHTYPGATVPFGFVQLSPDTRTQGWDSCSGYHYSDTAIFGFSHTHLSGTGCADFGDLLLLPLTGDLQESNGYNPLKAERFEASFSHEDEIAEPGYYRVLLKGYDTLAELTATAHAGMHRYTFSGTNECHVLLDLVHGLGNTPDEACLKVEGPSRISGFKRSDGWAKGRTVYFIVESSHPFSKFGLELDDKPLPTGEVLAKGKNVRGYLDFGPADGKPILLRVGLSPTSVDDAKRNLQTEMPGWDFDSIRNAAQAAWNENLSRITITSANPNIRQTFYSALYHTMSAPTLYNNADGSYLGSDKKTHSNAGFTYYSTFSLWDTFRAEHALLTLIQPERVNDFIQSMLVSYQQSADRSLPMWPLASCETWCMIGYHSIPVIWEAYAKGFRSYDVDLAYKAMRDTTLSGRNRQDEYQKNGYVPWVKGKDQATSRTLEFTYDDWCLGQMATALGKTADAELFTRRSQNFTNLWDPKTRFFRSKNPEGTFHEPFDPTEVANWNDSVASGSYTEANAWQYAFAVPHDVAGMIGLYGGKQSFISRLDELFDSDSDMPLKGNDVAGLIGQYAHGNEPCHHLAYLYALAGAQYKTARRVHEIMLTQYNNTAEGICGNDDCGQMSAWYVFSAIGLYPVNPASGIYVIGSPVVEKATIQLDPKYYKGGTFSIVAHNVSNQNIYIQSAKLNGLKLERPWITHEEVGRGGTLEFEMGMLPNKTWAEHVTPR